MIHPSLDLQVMIKEENPHFSRKNVEALAEWKGEPDWMRQQRLAAFELFEKLPMPGKKDEDWRRTDISTLEYARYLAFEAAAEKKAATLNELPDLVKDSFDDKAEVPNLLVHQNSSPIFHKTQAELENKGVLFMDLDQAVRQYPDLVREYFMKTSSKDREEKFVALHGAFWNCGTLLYVPRNVKVETSFRAINYMTRFAAPAFSHTLIVIDEGAEATFFEEMLSTETEVQAFADVVVEIFVRPQAKFQYVSLQNYSHSVYSFLHKRAHIERDAVMNWLVGTFGSRLSKSVIGSILLGAGSSTEMLGVSFGDADQLIDQNTLQIHQAPRTKSDLLFNTALKEKSHSIYKGTIDVVHAAQKTDAYQKNRNLIIGRHARADSIPALEILANDVRCTHGATVGNVDEEQIFYIMSRGLAREQAVKIVVDGFFDPVLRRVPDESIVKRMRKIVDAKTANMVM